MQFNKIKTLNRLLRIEVVRTSWDPPVVEASVTDSYGCQAPAPLRDRPCFGGAWITEALSTCTTVVLGVIGLELFTTFMAFLKHTDYSFKMPHHFYSVWTKYVTYQDERVGRPVGRSYLISEPRGHGFGRFDAEFRHWLRNVLDSIQQPLSSIVVVFQEAVRLKKNPTDSKIQIYTW